MEAAAAAAVVPNYVVYYAKINSTKQALESHVRYWAHEYSTLYVA